ncbi:MAG: tyrosine phosphatase family protein [Rhizomicrobium sp.]
MPFIVVTPLSGLIQSIETYRPSHLVTLLSPEHMIETPARISAGRHLRLALNDVADALGCEAPPERHHVARLIDFGRSWHGDAPLIVHCWAGISRSMAAAYTLLCDRAGPGRELEVARDLRAQAPHAVPNPLMVRLADEVLARGGRMVGAVASIGRGEIVAEGRCVILPLGFPSV